MTNHFVRAFSGAVVLFVLAGMIAIPASATQLVYVQNTDFGGAYASQNDPTFFGNFATAYDNFGLASTTHVSDVLWIGSYFGGTGSITGFTLTIYADNAGVPGTQVYTTGDVAGNAHEAFIGTDSAGNPTYVYGLTTAFTATGGSTYWMSIVPDLAFPPQWGWETGTGGDGASYGCFFGTCGSNPNDLSFALATPEPGSITLLVTGLLTLGAGIRRRLS